MYGLMICYTMMIENKYMNNRDGKNGEKYKPDKDEEYHTYVDIF